MFEPQAVSGPPWLTHGIRSASQRQPFNSSGMTVLVRTRARSESRVYADQNSPSQIGFVWRNRPLGPPISGSAQWRKLGLFVQLAPPVAVAVLPAVAIPCSAGNWLCFSVAVCRPKSPQLPCCKPLAVRLAVAQIGFVWRRSPVRSDAARRPVAGARTPVSEFPNAISIYRVCGPSTTAVPAVTRKLGLFVQPFFTRLQTTDYRLLPYWLCFFTASPVSHSSQLLIHTALVLPSARPEIGFVWRGMVE